MRSYRFHVVNVFAESTFGGNPLAVFEDGRGLSDAEQQALADQFNLSETTFIWPATTPNAAARVRIFSPGYEMAFAGHPTLGTSYVLSQLPFKLGSAFTLELKVGPIQVTSQGDRFELRSARPTYTDVVDPPSLGLDPGDVLPGARWVTTGTEHLLVPLRDVAAVRRCRPQGSLPRNRAGNVSIYVFAPTPTGFHVRFFWDHLGELREDPGTGSACANLGGWLLAQNRPLPLAARVEQGHEVGRLNVLSLRVDEERQVYVGGRVVPLMTGVVQLPDREG